MDANVVSRMDAEHSNWPEETITICSHFNNA